MNDRQSLLDEIDEQREVIRQLREQLAYLTMPTDHGFFEVLRLSKRERQMMGLLIAREFTTLEAMRLAFQDASGKEDFDPKNVDVIKCRLNKKLLPHGIAVRTQWGEGTYFTEDDKARLALLR